MTRYLIRRPHRLVRTRWGVSVVTPIAVTPTRPDRARARRRHHRRRWVLSSVDVERAWRRYSRSGELHCMWWAVR